MGRLKGSKNNDNNQKLVTCTLTPQERIKLLANLIIDKIMDDQRDGQLLLKKIQQK